MARGKHALVRELRRSHPLPVLTVVAMLAALLVFPGVAAASHTPAPASVTVPGSLQSELGCPGDWQPDCAATHLTYDVNDGVWQGVFAVPAGAWEYKAALNDSWTENYGANATRDGPNISLVLGAPTDVKFYYDHETHWITDNRNSVIATVPGNYQSELGCTGDWDPGCLRSWLQDPDGDGTYLFSTTAIPPGSYEAKVAIDESWAENYGAGGVQNGPNIPFVVMAPNSMVSFLYDPVTHILSVTVSRPPLTSVTVVGDFQSELGCAGDWQADCVITHLTYDGTRDVWQGVFAVPAGNWEAKAALNDSWYENYGAGGVQNGPNIPFTVGTGQTVLFSYDGVTHVLTVSVNTPPVAVDDSFSIPGDVGFALDVFANDYDVDGDTVLFGSATSPSHGTLAGLVIIPGDLLFYLYTPDTGFCGVDSFSYIASDGVANSNTATVTIGVCNDPPVANDDASTTPEDTAVTIDVLANDVDVNGDVLGTGSVTDPGFGSVVINSDDTVTYTPDLDYYGPDSFTYEACDPAWVCDRGTVDITVTSVNDPPVADANGPYVGIIGVPVSFDGTGSSDPDPAVLTFDWDFGDGSLVGTGAGPTPTHTYAMAASYTVALSVTDGGLTDTATTTASITLGSGSFDAVEATIEDMGLESAGFENSLLKKIQNAQKSFDNADGEACEKLASFIAAVDAQDGKKLTTEQADLLRSQAEAIGDAYGCDA